MKKKILLFSLIISILAINLASAYYWSYHDYHDEDGSKRYERRFWLDSSSEWDKDIKVKKIYYNFEYDKKKIKYDSYRIYPEYTYCKNYRCYEYYERDYTRHIDYSSWRYRERFPYYYN